MMRRKSLGRRKIEMKLIEDDNARTVTFSKRRVGVFKKATELSILCGAQIALIIFSLGGRAYSFGHPDVDSVINTFYNRNSIPEPEQSSNGLRINDLLVRQIKQELDEKKQELEALKNKSKKLVTSLENDPFQISDDRLSMLDKFQLNDLRKTLEKIRQDVWHRFDKSAQIRGVNEAGDAAKTVENVALAEEMPAEDVDTENITSNASKMNLTSDKEPIPDGWLRL